MHGLVNRALQCFLRDTYGDDVWRDVVRSADLGFENFEAMLVYEDAATTSVIDAASLKLSKPTDILLEDLGTYLVSHPNMGRLRRLLRFGGDQFVDFLHSLDDLPGRARLAVPDLEIPMMTLHDEGEGVYQLACGNRPDGVCHVILGALRAMADDYGALAMLDLVEDQTDPDMIDALADPREQATCTIQITLLMTSFAEGRSFQLSVLSS